jgi:hypothetical protein
MTYQREIQMCHARKDGGAAAVAVGRDLAGRMRLAFEVARHRIMVAICRPTLP